jgi:predicted aminopeptidase
LFIRARVVLFSSLCWLFGTGCQSISYYTQAIHGQSQVLHRRQSIESLLRAPDTPPALQEKLQLVLELRTFAESELQLPANGHYLSYADLGRRYALWNVYAAPEFSLEAKSWWYPVVGRLKYRGYFSEERARRLAAQLAKKGYDVHVGGVAAYSTLGWFRDPVLNTFIDYDEADLAELIFHELTHQRVFIAGDTEFNEALATTVAEEGARRWLVSRHDQEVVRAYQEEVRRHEQFIDLLTRGRARLKTFYATLEQPGAACGTDSRADSNADSNRTGKQEILEQLRRDYAALKESWHGNTDFDAWFKTQLNNARLNTVDTYYQLVPAFRTLLQAKGGDLEAFFKEVHALSKLRKSERRARLGVGNSE